MRNLLNKYKSVIKFILTFLLVYILLSLVYKFYLQFSDGSRYYPDYVTHLVAKQAENILNAFGYNAEVVPNSNEPSMKLILNDVFIARIIEGCNAMSVIVLFVSFIAAFSDKIKETILFILSGSVMIYIVNLLRIAILTVAVYHFPSHSEFLHGVVFPAIIYGMVFLLWMFWVNRFSKLRRKHE